MKLFFASFLALAACTSTEDEPSPFVPLCPCFPGKTYTCHCPEDGPYAYVQTGTEFCTRSQRLTFCVCAGDRYQLPKESTR